MNKTLWIIVLIIFALFFGLFTFLKVPIAITQDEIVVAVSDAIAESNSTVDSAEVQRVVEKSIENLEARQSKRLRYLVSAYFVIWLILILYTLRISHTQSQMRKRLDQLQASLEPRGTHPH
ncbi:MAG: CcmD family protein [Candidatus Poribacteria bacterium]|nr:CcmD family protein [Candidatus Poribacteria bacterium]